MTIYLRVQNSVAVSIFDLPPGAELADCVHPSVIDEFIPKGSADVGWIMEDGILKPPPDVSVDLDALKLVLKANIDAEAEAQRLKYITPGSGQAMTYVRKVEQAKAAQAHADPQPGDYPLLDASVGLDGADILAVAASVLAMDAAWEQIGTAIEKARLSAKKAIDLARTVEVANAVEVIWPKP